MKTLIGFVSLILLGSMAEAARPQSPLGRIRGFGDRTVLVETSNGRMVTVYRSSLSRKKPWKMGGWVTLKTPARKS